MAAGLEEEAAVGLFGAVADVVVVFGLAEEEDVVGDFGAVVVAGLGVEEVVLEEGELL